VEQLLYDRGFARVNPVNDLLRVVLAWVGIEVKGQ
jgi:hypothetical protein